jgi:hypothetical protein
MQYHRITDIRDPYFKQMHDLMKTVFPPEEVLAFEEWEEPLKDPGIRVFVAVQDDQVVGATEYRYYADMQVAMTDFTIIGKDGLGIGPFLVRERKKDLTEVVSASGGKLIGMFAEIYNPYLTEQLAFGGVKAMNPFVRREVLAHLGYLKIDMAYVHPSWQQDGEAVQELDLCFMPMGEQADAMQELPATLVSRFLETYYAILPDKPASWYDMVEGLKQKNVVSLVVI